MRISRLVVIVGALGLALAGCTSTSGGTAGGTPSATGPGGSGSTAPSAGTAVPACLVGTWKSTGMSRKDTVVGTDITSSGGGGVALTIGEGGTTTVDFAGMQPVVFSSTAGGTEIKGQYSNGGKVISTLKTTPTSDTAGTLEPTGTVDWSALTVTVDLSSPVKLKVFDNVKITDFTGSGAAQAGNAVDTQPILRKSMYDCGGTTLKLSPPAGVTGGGTWTFQKA
jgi:hypothetical protein